MAENRVDHLAAAGEAARLNDRAVRQYEAGRPAEALAAAGEAAALYRALAGEFPAMFGMYAERAEALAAAIREGRPRPSSVPSAAARPREPEVERTAAGVSAAGSARVRDEPGARPAPATVAPETPRTPEPPETHETPETPGRPAPIARPRDRARRRRTVVAAVVAVLLVAVAAVGWALTRPHTPPAPPPAPPPAAPPAPTWTATARTDVAPTGVTLRSAPSLTGAPVGRLPAGVAVPIQCGETGQTAATDTGERSPTWLRTTAGAYLAAINVEVRGTGPVPNCVRGRPPVPVPRSR